MPRNWVSTNKNYLIYLTRAERKICMGSIGESTLALHIFYTKRDLNFVPTD